MNVRVALAGLLVVVLGVAAWLFLRGGDDDSAASADDKVELPTTGTGAATGGGAPDRNAPTVPRTVEDPAVPGTAEAEEPVESGNARTMDDGSRVRDHRSGNPEPHIKPGLPHPSESPVTASVTGAVMRLVRPVVIGCLRDVPQSAYGEDPFIMIRAQFTIAESGELSITELGPTPARFDEASVAPALDCIRAAAGLTVRVDHAAVATATVGFPVRPR